MAINKAILTARWENMMGKPINDKTQVFVSPPVLNVKKIITVTIAALGAIFVGYATSQQTNTPPANALNQIHNGNPTTEQVVPIVPDASPSPATPLQ